MTIQKPVGWRKESARHALARKGIKTKLIKMARKGQIKCPLCGKIRYGSTNEDMINLYGM